MNNVDTTKNITHLSLCTGYEGIGLGLKRVLPTLREIAYVEIEAYAIFNLAKKIEQGWLSKAPIYTNLKTFPFGKFHGKVDILSGGFPCQPFSVAGSKKATEDPRHLFPYIAEGIKQCQPRIVWLENVSGIITQKTKDGEPVLNMSSDSWKDWVTELRQDALLRRKSVYRTEESESLSSAYPTPLAEEGWKISGLQNQPSLTKMVREGDLINYPTPSVAGCTEGGVAKHVELKDSSFKATRENGTVYGAKLRDAIVHLQNWATPNTMDCLPSRSYEAAVKQATTTRKGRTGPSNLREQVDPLMIKAYSDAKQSLEQTKHNTSGKSQGLWGTPKEQDSRACLTDRKKSNLGEQVQGMHDQSLTKWRLNPNWVEQLMVCL